MVKKGIDKGQCAFYRQSHPGNQHRRDFTKFTTPGERSPLEMVRWIGTLIEAIQYKIIFKAQGEIILQRTFKVSIAKGTTALCSNFFSRHRAVA